MRNTILPIIYTLLLAALAAACTPSPSQPPTSSTPPPPTAPPATQPSPATPTNTPLPPGALPPSIVDEFGVQMILIPEGIFTMGSDSPQADAHEGPPHDVYTDAVYMDAYEATHSLYAACVDSGDCPPPLRDAYAGNPDAANFPAVNLTWEMAQAFCTWRGARLPTEAEWEKAARWDPATGEVSTYPWGDQPPSGRYANTASTGTEATTEVGTYELGQSPLGLYDMAGNVWEWVADPYASNYYAASPGINPTGPVEDTGLRVLRGGSFGDDDFYARSTARTGVAPGWAGASGVRCARDP